MQVIIGDLSAAQPRPHLKDRITGIRAEHHVARVTQRQSHMGNALLRAVDRHDLLRIQRHTVTALIPVLNGLYQLRQISEGILIVVGILAGLLHSPHHIFIRQKIRGTNGQVIDRPSGLEQFIFLIVQHIKNAGLEGLHPLGKVQFHI